jgi:hypothetical protein
MTDVVEGALRRALEYSSHMRNADVHNIRKAIELVRSSTEPAKPRNTESVDAEQTGLGDSSVGDALEIERLRAGSPESEPVGVPRFEDLPDLAKKLEVAIRAKKGNGNDDYHSASAYNECVVCRLLWALTYPGPATITVAPAGAPSEPGATEKALREALARIADEGSGWRYKRDPLEHARSVIDEIRDLARAALSTTEPQEGSVDG